jgi:hypothetical protein
MAFSHTKTYEAAVGGMRITYGTFTGTAVAAGNIYTGLQKCLFIYLTPNIVASPTEQCWVTTTLPSVDPIGVAFTSGVCGWWFAVGY